MWLMTDTGFISAVAYDAKYDSSKRSNRQRKSWGKNPILARARLEGDLEQIRPFWSKLRIEADDTADYEFRAIIPRNRWVEFVASKAADIDYDSHFKEVAQKRSPGGPDEGFKRHSAYMRCWNALVELQPDKPYSGLKWWATYKDGGTYSLWEDDSYASSSALCAKFISTAYNGNTYRSWCIYSAGHTGDCKYESAVPKMNYKAETKYESFSAAPYDVNNPLDMPTTVIDMCRALIAHPPFEVRTDEATPYATYDLWARACEEFYDALTANDLLDILEELAQDEHTASDARQRYEEAIESYIEEAIYEL